MKKIAWLVVLALLASAPKFAKASSDGVPSTGSFTINSVAPLSAATATGSLVVLDTITLRGVRVNIGAYSFQAGVDYQVGASSNAAAHNLAAAIEASQAPVEASALSGDNTVSLTAVDSGSLYNGVSLRTSNSLEVSTSANHLTGGQDNAVVRVNAVPLVQGRDWFVQDVASNTAISLAAAINYNPDAGRLVQAQPLGSVVFLRSTLSPVAYTLSSSDQTDLAASGAAMTGGSAGLFYSNICDIGTVDALPSGQWAVGCRGFLSTTLTRYISTNTRAGSWSPY